MLKQRTLSSEAVLEGIGVHSGKRTRVVCRPAGVNSGLVFERMSSENHSTRIVANLDAAAASQSLRRTVLRHENGWSVETPEHLLGTCLAFGVTNLTMEMDGNEVPILDGSALPIAEAFSKAGVVDQEEGPPPASWTVREPLVFSSGEAEFAALPSRDLLTVAYYLDFPETAIGNQAIVAPISSESYLREIAAARTFVLEADIEALRRGGLIKGGNPEMTVVVGRHEFLNPPLRFSDECVRHKVIDFLGDLALLGGRPTGHFMILRGGHTSHLAFGHYLRKDQQLQWIHPPN